MSTDTLGTSCDQCRSMVQYILTSTETIRLIRDEEKGVGRGSGDGGGGGGGGGGGEVMLNVLRCQLTY